MDSFIGHHSMKASAAIVHNVGFAACDWQSLDLLSNLLTAYLSRLAHLLSTFVEHCGREEPSLADALTVLESVIGAPPLDELADGYMDYVAPFSHLALALPIFPVLLNDIEGDRSRARMNVAEKIHARATERVAEARNTFPGFGSMGASDLRVGIDTLNVSSTLGHDISVDSLASPIMAMRRPMKSLKLERRLHKVMRAPEEQRKKRREVDAEKALKRAASNRVRAKERHERKKQERLEKKYSAWRPPQPPAGTVWLEAVPIVGKSDPMSRSHRLFNELVVEKRSLTWPFLYPVQAEELGMTDYHDVVKTPMDLSTIRHKLMECEYGGDENLFISDVVLMCDNCMLYHALYPARVVHQLAKRLKAFIGNRWDHLLLEGDDGDGQDAEQAESDMEDAELDISAVDGIEAPSRLLKLDNTADEEVQEKQLESLLVFLQTKLLGCQEFVSQLQTKMKELINFKWGNYNWYNWYITWSKPPSRSKRMTARRKNKPVPSIPRVLKNIKNEILMMPAEATKERLVLRILRSDLGLKQH